MTSNREKDQALTRRGFLLAGAAGAAAWSLGRHRRATAAIRRGCDERSVIMICNLGGPSQLDTWDPKPHAAREVRGPFQPIQTSVPGIFVSELFPHHGRIAKHLALVRSCHHTSPAVHHAGWQCMQTGREHTNLLDSPHVGSVAGYLLGERSGLPPHVVLPAPMRTSQPPLITRSPGRRHGQSAGFLGPRHDPPFLDAPLRAQMTDEVQPTASPELLRALNLSADRPDVSEPYGNSPFGRRCLAARRLVEAGIRCVTVNTHIDLFQEETWDAHGRAPFGTVLQLRERLAPAYDQAVAALIEDLSDRGLLSNTLVCCLAEFGRTPRINSEGGRDHWPQCFTTYFAGGGVQGGQVIGRSDDIASEPVDRPVPPAEIAASILYSLGLEPSSIYVDPSGRVHPIVNPSAQPVRELF